MLAPYGAHGMSVLLPQTFRELNRLFHAPIFAVDGKPGAKAAMSTRLDNWRPCKPKLLKLLLRAFDAEATLRDGSSVVLSAANMTKWATRRAAEQVLEQHMDEVHQSLELAEDQRTDRLRAKLAMGFIGTDTVQVIRMLALNSAKDDGKLDSVEITQHATDSTLGGSAGRGTGVVANAACG